MKKTFRTLHLYLSLAAGLFIVISCITGIIMVFEEEINHQINHQRYFVEKKMNRLPLDQLVQNHCIMKRCRKKVVFAIFFF